MIPYRTLHPASLFLLLASACLLAGCGSGTATITPVTPVNPYIPPIGNYQGGVFTGQALAGSAAVVGATVQLYAAGTAGNGSAPVQLLATGLTTDATGSFNVNVPYTCPYNISILYVVVSGGHVGTGASNPGSTLMSSPGACSSVTGTPKLVINEVTTVASAYAFAQFLAPGAQLGAASTNSSGITLAAGTLANLVNLNAGTMPGAGFPMLGTAPRERMYSLANALDACLVSTGSTSQACTGLFSAAAVSGSAPSNTLDAALNVAKNPGNNVAAVYALTGGSSVFTPALTAAPNDWTMFVTYTGGGMNDPAAVSIDSTGRVWVSNYFGAASLFSNTGTAVFASGITGNSLNESFSVAVDGNDSAWVTNRETSYSVNGGLGSITVLNAAGAATAGASGYTAGGINFPLSVAFDTTGRAWVVDYGNSHLTLLNSSGTPLSGPNGFTDLNGSLQFPVSVAVDSKGNGYIGNSASNMLVKMPADGSSFTSFACCSFGASVAIDGSDNAWVTNYYGDSIGLVSAAGKIVSGGGFTGGGVVHPQGLAIDGAGKAWVTNFLGHSISELAAANSALPGQVLSPSTGWGADAMLNGDHALVEGFGIAIDASGNLWVSSFGNKSLTEFVGMATPVKTPLIGPVRVP